ncbi:helix-turn-helix domain-containing protein [Promicromonospora sp. MS192]|uniref:helix-turn-helix domain-containing protein n=1 Tax=Promicromonospora sp. MS192 TaxID=3412684 RepID=UPI003C2CB56C
MAQRDVEPIGARVRYWRQRRMLSRPQLASLVDRSVSWLEKVEAGERPLHNLDVIERLATALSVETALLVDGGATRAAQVRVDAAEVTGIRDALAWYPVTDPDHGRSLDEVVPVLDRLGAAWLESEFVTVGRYLPGLLVAVQQLPTDGTDSVAVARVQVKAYRLACSMLLKYRHHELAWLAADRAMAVGDRSGDDIALARATRSVARALSHNGQSPRSIRTAVAMADRLAPLTSVEEEALPLRGMLLLAAQITAANLGDADTARELHLAAAALARGVNETRRHETQFGPTNVAFHRVAALVRLREPADALAVGRTVSPHAIATMPIERRATYFLDLAEALLAIGRPSAALGRLLDADASAPQEVRGRPVSADLVRRLLSTRECGRDERLRSLADEAGIAA